MESCCPECAEDAEGEKAGAPCSLYARGCWETVVRSCPISLFESFSKERHEASNEEKDKKESLIELKVFRALKVYDSLYRLRCLYGFLSAHAIFHQYFKGDSARAYF
mmetsp:Transcript_55883/g.88551  ORF Transcript_55883/g.88551 Transcript_55883/m.88551 type:complete len:107 (-) Transcript_55883:51-371(-)